MSEWSSGEFFIDRLPGMMTGVTAVPRIVTTPPLKKHAGPSQVFLLPPTGGRLGEARLRERSRGKERVMSRRLHTGLLCVGLCLPMGQTTLAMDTALAPPVLTQQIALPVESASEVLERLFVEHPAARERFHALLEDAHGFAVFPGLIKAGFLVANIYGRGVLTYRDEQGRWSPPVLLTIRGQSVGPQIGLLVSDVLIVMKTRRSLEGLLTGGMKLGMDAPPLSAGEAAEIVSYALRRGAMIGQSIDEYVVSVDNPGNLTLYGQTLQPGEIARGIRMGLRLPMPAQKFVERVNMLSGRPAGAIEWR